MSDIKQLNVAYSPREQHGSGKAESAQPGVRLERRLATVLPLTRPRGRRHTTRRIESYVYFIQLTDHENRPLSEYVGANLDIVNACDDLRVLRTFDCPELAIYFCRAYADQFHGRRFRYRARRPARKQCE